MVAMGPFRSPLRPGWVTGSALLSGVCSAHARSSGIRQCIRQPRGCDGVLYTIFGNRVHDTTGTPVVAVQEVRGL
jgi:hypothetical protein